MGVDITTHRARIGMFVRNVCWKRRKKNVGKSLLREVVLHSQIYEPHLTRSVLHMLLLCTLVVTSLVPYRQLMLSGDVEANPGPEGQYGEGEDDSRLPHPPQLKDLVLLEVPPDKWYTLGLQLDIIEYDLDVIRMNKQGDVQACKIEMFKKWLKCRDSASYINLSEALKRIGEQSLAAEVLNPSAVQTGSCSAGIPIGDCYAAAPIRQRHERSYFQSKYYMKVRNQMNRLVSSCYSRLT